jgi:hypothetical protein
MTLQLTAEQVWKEIEENLFAVHRSVKPISACVPSQYGLFFEWPQRQSVTRLRTS